MERTRVMAAAALERLLVDRPISREEVDLLLDTIRREDEEVLARLDLRPDIAGYFDFEYFNDDRPGSPGEFRQHRFSIIPSKDYKEFRLFAEIEFEYGALETFDVVTHLSRDRLASRRSIRTLAWSLALMAALVPLAGSTYSMEGRSGEGGRPERDLVVVIGLEDPIETVKPLEVIGLD